MQPTAHIELAHGRVVAVGPGLVDVVLDAECGARLARLVLATEHRFRIEMRGEGPLAGGRGRIEAEFVVSADGSFAEHEVVLSIHTEAGGGRS